MQSSPVCSHENSHCHKQDHTSLLLKTLMTLANSREKVTALVTSCEAPCALAPTSPTLHPTTPLLPGAPLCRSQGTARAWSSAWMPSLLIVLVKSPSSDKAHLAVAFPRLFSRPEALALSLSLFPLAARNFSLCSCSPLSHGFIIRRGHCGFPFRFSGYAMTQ